MDPFSSWIDIPAFDIRFLSFMGIAVHWWILQFSIGLIVNAVFLEILWKVTGNDNYQKMSKTLSKVSVVIFAVGAVTGTLSEFGLLLMWPNLMRLVGKYFFLPMYLEIFAFLSEAVLIYMYYYTWDRMESRAHITVGILSAIGAIVSALMIMSVNNLMQIPFGLHPHYDPMTGIWTEPSYTLYTATGAVTLTSTQVRDIMLNDIDLFHEVLFYTTKEVGIFGIVFNQPGVIASFVHATLAAILTCIYTIIGVYSYRYFRVKDEHKQYYLDGIKIFSLISLGLMLIQGLYVGHKLGTIIAKYNPEKLAAMEGTSATFFSLTGSIPIIGDFLMKFVAFLAYGDFNAILPNYDAIPDNFKPPLFIHYVYYLKIFLSMFMGFNSIILVLYFYAPSRIRNWKIRGIIIFPKTPHIKHLKLNYASPFIIQFISTFGWMTKEIGRKPWTVYGLVRVDEAVTTNDLPLYMIILIILYLFTLGFGLLFLVRRVFRMDENELLDGHESQIEKLTTDNEKIDEEIIISKEEKS